MYQRFEDILSKRQFVPFTITTVDGGVISVDNPDTFLANRVVLVVLDEQQMLHHFAWRNIVDLVPVLAE
jgi:hypothetical protein